MLTSTFLVFLTAQAPCRAVEGDRIERSVATIVHSQGFEQLGAIADLQHYWRTRCLEARQAASKSALRSLARLLKVPRARLPLAGLLIDVGPQLSIIQSEVQHAARDQRRLEEAQRRSTSPLLPSTYNVVYDGLLCITMKIRSRRVDKNVCETAIGTNEASDEYWNQADGSTDGAANEE